jgi:hypothetical protein
MADNFVIGTLAFNLVSEANEIGDPFLILFANDLVNASQRVCQTMYRS